jgi:hypothetical protein
LPLGKSARDGGEAAPHRPLVRGEAGWGEVQVAQPPLFPCPV